MDSVVKIKTVTRKNTTKWDFGTLSKSDVEQLVIDAVVTATGVSRSHLESGALKINVAWLLAVGPNVIAVTAELDHQDRDAAEART